MTPYLLYAHPPTQLSTFSSIIFQEGERVAPPIRSFSLLQQYPPLHWFVVVLRARACLPAKVHREEKLVSQMSSFHRGFIYLGGFHRTVSVEQDEI